MAEGLRRAADAIERVLEQWWMPLVAGALTALAVYLHWGGANVPGFVHDERSYLVQARLLAHGMLTAPSPPMPAFWEMAHVFVEPTLFSKYPPGHAPLLVPGVWLGLQGLMPILLSGLAGGLIFSLARRLQGGWIALLAWSLWVLSPFTMRWHATYFSQLTTTPLWLGALSLLLSWTKQERPWMLVGIVACIAWMGITRPVTGIALMIPIAVVVLRTSWTRRSVAGWGRAAIVGGAICAIVPLWANATLGSPTKLPYVEYSRWYFPFDLPGFDRDTSPPLRQLPPDLVGLADSLHALYDPYTPDKVPSDFVRRLRQATAQPLGVAAQLAPVAIVGAVFVGGGVFVFVSASVLLLLAAYLVMPQPDNWTIYSLETFAVMPFLVAAGIVHGLQWLQRRSSMSRATGLVPAAVVSLLFIVVVLRATAESSPGIDIRTMRTWRLQQMVTQLPDERAVIFVHRSVPMSAHFTVWDILGPPETTPLWIVRSLGAEQNAELVKIADGRAPYLLDELTMTLWRIDGLKLSGEPVLRATSGR